MHSLLIANLYSTGHMYESLIGNESKGGFSPCTFHRFSCLHSLWTLTAGDKHGRAAFHMDLDWSQRETVSHKAQKHTQLNWVAFFSV